MAINGGYILGQTIGSGATATVSLAVNAVSGDLFAVKSSHISRSSILQEEQTILSSLSSPHIISCLGSTVSGDSFHLFLELAAGGALSDYAGNLKEPKIRSFTRQILLALSYLHSNGIAHCDVKGQNVLVFSDRNVKLADFGCARRVRDGLAMGTPAFMAPEVLRGEEQGVAGDVWSLGCTVVEMATGRSPWPDDNNNVVAAIHRIGFSRDVPAMPEWASDEAKDFVSKCLVRDQKERWTADQLLSHPFVGDAEKAEDCSVLPCFELKQGKWISPKRTLDFGLWDVETEKDYKDESFDMVESSSERLKQLVSPAADWSWSDDWIEVRGRNDEGEYSGGDDMDSFSYSVNHEIEESGSASFVDQSEAGDVDIVVVTHQLVSSCNGHNDECNKSSGFSYFTLFFGVLMLAYIFETKDLHRYHCHLINFICFINIMV